jgi:hypothetical protein
MSHVAPSSSDRYRTPEPVPAYTVPPAVAWTLKTNPPYGPFVGVHVGASAYVESVALRHTMSHAVSVRIDVRRMVILPRRERAVLPPRVYGTRAPRRVARGVHLEGPYGRK